MSANKLIKTQYIFDGVGYAFKDADVLAVGQYIEQNPYSTVREISWATNIVHTRINQMLLIVPYLFGMAKNGKVALEEKGRGRLPRWVARLPDQSVITYAKTSADHVEQGVTQPSSLSDTNLISAFDAQVRDVDAFCLEAISVRSPAQMKKLREKYLTQHITSIAESAQVVINEKIETTRRLETLENRFLMLENMVTRNSYSKLAA